MRISNFKIITRIIISFLIILILSIATIGFLIIELKGTENKVEDLYSIYIISNSSYEIQKNLDLLKDNINDCVLALETGDKDKLAQSTLVFTAIHNSIDTNLKILNKWIKDTKGLDLLSEVEKAFGMLATIEKDINELYDNNNIVSIKEILDKLNESQSNYNIKLYQMGYGIKMSADSTYNLTQQYILKDIIISLTVTLILLVVSVFIIIFLSKNISKSISFFKEIFKKGSSGNLNAKYPVKSKAKDEINELGTYFNNFINEVKEVIKEVIDTSNDLGASSEEVSGTVNNFAENSQSQAASSEEITATMEEIGAGVDNVSGNSQFQYNMLNEFISQIKELSELINSMAGRITEAQGLSKNIAEQARAGNESLGLMDSIMSKITESSNKVSDIVSIIVNISDKINLLSLNAAIEAARAGEAGRGFAVVADEISKLADQTAASISDIDSLIKKNKDEIGNGMTNVFNTVDNIGRVIDGVESINSMMSNIFSDMERQKTANESVNRSAEDLRIRYEEVKNSTEEQRIAISEIMKSISNINDLIQSSAAGAEEMTVGATKLASMAENLRNRISFFQI